MTDFNTRLGRLRGPMTRYYQRIQRQKLNELAKERGLKGDFARSLLLDPDDEYERAYTEGEHAAK